MQPNPGRERERLTRMKTSLIQPLLCTQTKGKKGKDALNRSPSNATTPLCSQARAGSGIGRRRTRRGDELPIDATFLFEVDGEAQRSARGCQASPQRIPGATNMTWGVCYTVQTGRYGTLMCINASKSDKNTMLVF